MKGVYCITNVVNGKKYIGQSKNIMKRWEDHIRNLHNGTHANSSMQTDFNKYGIEVFSFKVVELVNACTPELLQLETNYILENNSHIIGYNVFTGDKEVDSNIAKQLLNIKGIELGRPKLTDEDLPRNFAYYMKLLSSKQIKKYKLAEHLGVSRPTLDRYIKIYNQCHSL